MHTICVDIETIPLPLEAREFMRRDMTKPKIGNLVDPKKIEAKIAESIREFESGEGCGLDDLQGQIAIIGYCINDEPYHSISLTDGNTERKMLAEFWSCLSAFQAEIEIVGHNIKGFDGPFLIHRSWINGLQPPRYYVHDLASYNSRQWQDTMQFWKLGNKQADARKLASICGAFGIKVKTGEITGANFAEWWEKDKAACIEYNKGDVLAVRELWQKIGH